MMRIHIVAILGAYSGSSRVEDLLRANAPPHPSTQNPAGKSALDNPNILKAGITAKAYRERAPQSTAQSVAEE
jgi:hypothetical protein